MEFAPYYSVFGLDLLVALRNCESLMRNPPSLTDVHGNGGTTMGTAVESNSRYDRFSAEKRRWSSGWGLISSNCLRFFLL